jgi:hypothetical protein
VIIMNRLTLLISPVCKIHQKRPEPYTRLPWHRTFPTEFVARQRERGGTQLSEVQKARRLFPRKG